ncbi:MAG: hypothetical protein HYZ53_11330 [Planctomycetes bacterium]|nr:hypothetical protein [Planctomycetota bacterium]
MLADLALAPVRVTARSTGKKCRWAPFTRRVLPGEHEATRPGQLPALPAGAPGLLFLSLVRC